MTGPETLADEAERGVLPVSRWLYLVLLATSVGMPTGSVFGFNVKWALLAVTCVALLLEGGIRLSERQLRVVVTGGAAALVIFAFATFSLLRGNDVTLLLTQLKEFLAVAFVVTLGLVLLRPEAADVDRSIDALLVGAGLFSAAKMVAAAAVLMGVLSFGAVTELAAAVFGQTASGLEFDGSLVRIQLGNDFAMPYLLYFALVRGRAGTWLRKVALAVIAVGAVVSLSRFVWFALACALLGAWLRTVRARVIGPSLALAAVTGLLYWAATGTEMGQSTVEARFHSDAATGGDLTRSEQRSVLLEEAWKRPLLGKGMGTYTDRLIRSEEAPYSYENQWLALLMQLGLVGLAALLVFPVVIASGLLGGQRLVPGLTDVLMLGVFLLQGFFNPNLTSSTSGAVLLVFALLAGRRSARDSGAPASVENPASA